MDRIEPVFETLFDVIPFGIYIVDVETYEIVYINRVMQQRVGEPNGSKCWQAIYRQNSPCLHCPIQDILSRESNALNESVVLELFSDVDDCWYQLQEKIISWPDGRKVKYSIAVDISELKGMQNELSEAHAELSLAHRELERTAVTDVLTKIYNRAKLDQVLRDENQRKNRYSTPLSLILLDIDRFKSVNDTHGHMVGDSVLMETADIMRKHIRNTDTLGRWGGEEFLIICPNTDLENAKIVAEKLRSALDDHIFDVVESCTGSFGVALFGAEEDSDSVLRRADEALYRAKERGRNRVEVSF